MRCSALSPVQQRQISLRIKDVMICALSPHAATVIVCIIKSAFVEEKAEVILDL